MEFIETSVFGKRVQKLLSDDDYAELQQALIKNPEAGRLIREGHGLRKVRWASSLNNRGKRGGIRVIYCDVSSHRIYMLYIYAKNERENLDRKQLKMLCDCMRED